MDLSDEIRTEPMCTEVEYLLDECELLMSDIEGGLQ